MDYNDSMSRVQMQTGNIMPLQSEFMTDHLAAANLEQMKIKNHLAQFNLMNPQ